MLDEAVALAFPGARTACFVEWEAYAQACLLARMEEASLEPALVWSDSLESFPANQFTDRIDWIAAGFPCQPHSAAGKRKGVEDARWIWGAIAEIIRVVRPQFVFLENVRGLLSSSAGAAFATVLGDLARLGFDAQWTVLRASEVGAAHQRARVFILAHRPGERLGEAGRDYCQSACGFAGGGATLADSESKRRRQGQPESGGIAGGCDAAGSRHPLADTECGFVPREEREPEGRDGIGPAGTDVLGESKSVHRRTGCDLGSARGCAEPESADSALDDTAGPRCDRAGQRAAAEAVAGHACLARDARTWPTPAARDAKGANSEAHVTTTGSGRMHMDQLPNFVAHSFSHPAPTPISGPTPLTEHRTLRRRLNPIFVCWLMGWPWWWTRAEPMPFGAEAMAWWRCRLLRRLDTLLED